MIYLGELFPRALSRPITLKEACGDIGYLVLGSHGSYKGRVVNAALEPSPTLCKSGLPSYKHGVFELGQKPPTASQLKTKRWGETAKGKNHPVRFSLTRLDWNKPVPTIQKTATGSTGTMHPDEPRELYAGELKRIGSYPDKFEFTGKWEEVLARIGNSVPPLLMRAIALQIKSVLFNGELLKPYPKGTKYLDILESSWQDHLAPRQPGAPTVISTFAGGGGSSLGYSMAGYRELLAVEWDDNAVATFKLNFPDVPVYHGDIAKLSVEQCLEMTGIQPGELDVLDGSPPCQGFSTAGKRLIDDPRNQLFREYVRLLRGLRPKVFVMENVSGMVKGKMKLVFAEILRELKASGYRVSARLLNAMYFYVPQSRERMIFIGVRDDLGIEPSHPKAESRPVTVRQAWEGLRVDKTGLGLTALYSQYWRTTRPGDSLGKLQTTKKLSYDRPAYTIVKSEGNGGLYHPAECRMLHLCEFMRIASYPDRFRWAGQRKDWQERIGNSVPPLLMRSIARHVRQQILTGNPAAASERVSLYQVVYNGST